MSGIFGFVSACSRVVAADVAVDIGAQLKLLDHQVVSWSQVDEHAALGNQHIGLLNTAHQPHSCTDSLLWACLCGEFYHVEALYAAFDVAADDPLTLVLALYRRGGVAALSRLEGAFTLAIWDARHDELIVMNDRFGLYPHYYAQTPAGFVFAPTIKAVAQAPAVSRTLNRVALAEYLRFQQLLGDKTWLVDVQTLPPASILSYRPDEQRASLRRYWDWDQIPVSPDISFYDAVDESHRLLQRAVRTMTRPPLRSGLFLSGGLDSRILLGILDQAVSAPCVTFGQAGSRDVLYAQQLARAAGRHHHWFPLDDGRWVLEHAALHLALIEGQQSWMHAHGISTLSAVRGLMDVNLSGWDGETTLGGAALSEDARNDLRYQHTDEPYQAQVLFDAFVNAMTWPGLSEAEAQLLIRDRELHQLPLESLRAELQRLASFPAARRFDYFVIEHNLRRSLQNQIVMLRAAIEVRCPYFDYSLVEFMYSLPDTIRCDPQFRRSLLTRHMPAFARIRYERDNLPPHSNRLLRGSFRVAQRLRHAVNRLAGPVFPERPRLYADYEQYLRSDLRPWAEDLLFGEQARARGLYDQKTLNSLWQRHLAGHELWTIGKIAPLMTLELVLRLFIDDQPAALAVAAEPQLNSDCS
jgi:asparagine synthase (glutamine-hydrolysing)